MLIDEGGLSIDSDLDGQGTAPNSGSELLFGAWLGESEEERGMDRYRTGGGARYQPSSRWQPVRRQQEGDLIGDPIDPKRGHLVPENGKPVVERNITCAGSAAPEEMGGDTGAATENGDSLAGERGEWRKKDQRSGEKRGLDGRTTAVEVGDSREGGG